MKHLYIFVMLLYVFSLTQATTIEEERLLLEKQFLNLHKGNIGALVKAHDLITSCGISLEDSRADVDLLLQNLTNEDIYIINQNSIKYLYCMLEYCAELNDYYTQQCVIDAAFLHYNIIQSEIKQDTNINDEMKQKLIHQEYFGFFTACLLIRNAILKIKS